MAKNVGKSGQPHAPAALPHSPPGKEPQYPLTGRLGGPHSRPRRFCTKLPPSAGIRTLDRPARWQSPHRLRYPGSLSAK